MLEDKHFLYRHIRLDNNEPFYIGIGTKTYYITKDLEFFNKDKISFKDSTFS